MPADMKITVKGAAGRLLWDLDKQPIQQKAILSNALDVILGLRSVVKVIKDAWTEKPAGKPKAK